MKIDHNVTAMRAWDRMQNIKEQAKLASIEDEDKKLLDVELIKDETDREESGGSIDLIG